MEFLSLDLKHIKQEYFFLADYGKDMQGTYITNLHPQAFAKKDTAVLPLTYLLAFFVFRCENFAPITPKDEFGMVLLDIADLYAQDKTPTQEQVNEAITAILLEFVRFNADYNKAFYSILCDFVSQPSENSPQRSSVERGIIPNAKKADDENKPKPKSNYTKLNEAIEKGEFKNKQVRDRAVAVYKLLHNCEPTADDLKMQPSEEDKERIRVEREIDGFDLTPRQYSQSIASGV